MAPQLKQYMGRSLSADEHELVEKYKSLFNAPIFKVNAESSADGYTKGKKEKRKPPKPQVKL